jgi:HEPN domain-containing protein
MLPDNVEEAREWWHRTVQDLAAAEWLFAGGPGLVDSALFHCQQVAEKALKSYLAWRDQPFPRTHNIATLRDMCIALEPQFNGLEDEVRALTEYATELRYPSALPSPTPAEAQELSRLPRRVYDFVLARLPPEVTIA